jgi:hypothetical protein
MASGDITTKYGSASSLTITLNSLANGSLATSSALDIAGSSNPVEDVMVEITLGAITATGNKQAIIYAVSSVDGTNFGDNTQTDNMIRIGTLSLPTSATYRSQACSVASAFRTLPPQFKVVVQNDAGVSFAASGNSAQYRFVYKNIAP